MLQGVVESAAGCKLDNALAGPGSVSVGVSDLASRAEVVFQVLKIVDDIGIAGYVMTHLNQLCTNATK